LFVVCTFAVLREQFSSDYHETLRIMGLSSTAWKESINSGIDPAQSVRLTTVLDFRYNGGDT